jgi:hypothetical protein
MTASLEEVLLSDGTLVRHRVNGYLGRIEGVTSIQSCFTNHGAPMPVANNKESFQYRVIVQGEKTRRIAPVRDLEVLAAGTQIEVTCFGCQLAFSGNPGLINKPGGLCECGAWICPACLACRPSPQTPLQGAAETCLNQHKRLLKKATYQKRPKRAESSTIPVAKPAAQRFRN